MMKSTILILGVLAVFAFKANAQHEHHSMDNNTMQHGEAVQENDVDVTFQMQFVEVIKSNQLLNEAFVTGEQKKVAKAVTSVQNSLSKVDMKLLSGDAHMKWMDEIKMISNQLSIIASANSIADQRDAFIEYNKSLYESIKAFGLSGQTVYFQYCPMANNGNGANWLSLEKEIKNPYLGQKMLTCGTTKEELN